MACDCTRPGGCAACSYDLDPSGQPCKHCGKLIYCSGLTFWIHIDGTRFCHQSLNDDYAEPRN
jgi:hypothetical protein